MVTLYEAPWQPINFEHDYYYITPILIKPNEIRRARNIPLDLLTLVRPSRKRAHCISSVY